MRTTNLEAVSTCVFFNQPTYFTRVLKRIATDYMPALLEGVVSKFRHYISKEVHCEPILYPQCAGHGRLSKNILLEMCSIVE